MNLIEELFGIDKNNRMWGLLLPLAFILLIIHHVTPVRQIFLEGDIMLGGLFPIHEAGRNTSQCGKIKADQGVQRMVAMLFTLESINQNPRLLPNIKLGAQILDSWFVF